MEGMDLWNMFSSDFVEGDATNQNEHIHNDHNDANNRNVKQEVLDDEEEEEDDDDGEYDEEDMGELELNKENPSDNVQNHGIEDGAGSGNGGNGTSGDPDDDAIFNFDLRPMKKEDGQGRVLRDFPRTTPSQINATDENGVLINYELGVIYICPACGSEYAAQDQWKAHMNQLHHYNTRRGLNFVRIDKLYHQCLECRKHIAMHSMENLLKHKFTHLPHRCTKCSICMRQYKYRQDLMVHLRMLHRDDVVLLMREGMGNAVGATSTRHHPTSKYYSSNVGGSRLSITDVKANAVEMFTNTDDAIEVRNEPELDSETMDDTNNAYALRSFLDDDVSRSSSQISAKRGTAGDNGVNDASTVEPSVNGGGTNCKEEVCEDYIHYICPQCGQECETQSQWSQHIEFVHDFVSKRGLNFKAIGNQQVQCQECNMLIEPSYIKALQLHKFSHLPNSEWMRCKLCYNGFSDRKDIQQHLLKQHHLDTVVGSAEDDTSLPAFDNAATDGGSNLGDDDQLLEASVSSGPVCMTRGRGVGPDDKYEPHIDYLCPQCGKVFFEKKMWRKHVMKTHHMNDLSTLNFKYLNDRQLQCNECDKIITNAYGIQNAQQHRITHLPYKAFARCRICRKSYTDRKGLVKHIATRHRIGVEDNANGSKMSNSGQGSSYEPLTRTPKTSEPRKEIVTVKNQTYEIVFLDEDDDAGDCEPDVNCDDAVVSESVLGSDADVSAYGRSSRFKCVDCGSLFPSQHTLQKHINEEHEFLDYQKDNAPAQQEERPSTPPTRLLRSLLKDKDSDAIVPTPVSSSNTVAERNFIYMCPSCGKEYKTQFDWRRHINEKHNFDKRVYLNMRQIDKYRYQCTQCKDIVCNPKLKGLQDHHFRHLPYRLYLKCLVCGTCYNHKPNIMSHLRTRHNICEDATDGSEPNTTTALNATHQAKVPYDATPPMGPKLSKPRMLDNTVTVRPPGLNTIEDNISYHNAVDLDFITYYCPKCNKNFDSHAFWRKHIVEVHNYNSREGLNFRQIDNHHYLCLECYKRVTVTHTKGAIGQLQSHKFRHLPYRSFKCLTCNAEFVRKQMFFKHLNRESNRCDNKSTSDSANALANDEDDNENNISDKSMTDSVSATAGQEHTTDGKPSALMEQDVDLTVACNEEDDDGDEVDAVNDVTHMDPTCYTLLCPQCGIEFDTYNNWREHINVKHSLGQRSSLNLSRLDSSNECCYQCHICDEKLLTNKLNLLQLHCFKHLPFGAYIRCQLCSVTSFSTIHDLEEHLCQRHPHAMQLPQESGNGDQNYDDGDNSNSHQYIPLPPHMLDDDVDFDDQYLLG